MGGLKFFLFVLGLEDVPGTVNLLLDPEILAATIAALFFSTILAPICDEINHVLRLGIEVISAERTSAGMLFLILFGEILEFFFKRWYTHDLNIRHNFEDVNMNGPNKYPSTYHWPWSKTVQRDDSVHKNHENFLDRPVIITEKIDGGNTGLFNGEVYARSVTSPSHDGWMAMVRKNHAWKTNAPEFKDMEIYGEDIYGVHSIEYSPVNELDTYMIFAVRFQGMFLSWDDVCSIAKALDIKTVPVLAKTTYESASELTAVLEAFTNEPSRIGTVREGCVIRIPEAFPASEFGTNVCKYVRPNHVQTDQHWRVNWQPCKVIY